MAQQAVEVAVSPESLAERLLLLRRRVGISQGALARRMTELGASIQTPTISAFESGRRRPTLRQLLALCRVLTEANERRGRKRSITPADLGVTAEDYPDAAFYQDAETLELLQHIRWRVKRARDQRVLAPGAA